MIAIATHSDALTTMPATLAALLEELGRAAVEMRPGRVLLQGRAQAGERWKPRRADRARPDGATWGPEAPRGPAGPA